MTERTVAANKLAIKALRCPEGKARVVCHIDGHGNDGLKLYVESSGTKTWYFRARARGSDPKDMPLGRWPDVTIGEARKPLKDCDPPLTCMTAKVRPCVGRVPPMTSGRCDLRLHDTGDLAVALRAAPDLVSRRPWQGIAQVESGQEVGIGDRAKSHACSPVDEGVRARRAASPASPRPIDRSSAEAP
jgi:hypothetical protein